MARVYVSLPLGGPVARGGREVLRGVELAFEQASPTEVELVVLDSNLPSGGHQAEANAGRAALMDEEALAYIGEYSSGEVATSAPILGDAGLLQIAPVATWTELSGPTLVRLMPNDRAVAGAIAAWCQRSGIEELLVVHDHDDGYGVPVGAMCAEATRAAGIETRARPVWDATDEIPRDVGSASAVLYVGVAGSGVIGLWEALSDLRPSVSVLGTEGIAVPWLASALTEEQASVTRFFVSRRAPLELYGFEAMALALDAIDAGAGERRATVDAARAVRDRDSVIGTYSIDADGLTTASECGCLAVVDGEIVWDGTAG
jgi:branched-chain amino acid transport system substrate-binding protein